MKDIGAFVRAKLRCIEPWRWALLFFWFALFSYSGVRGTGSTVKLSFFDLFLYGMIPYNFGVEVWFPLSLMLVVPTLSFRRALSAPELKLRDAGDYKRWVLSYGVFALVLSSLVILLYIGAYFLVSLLFFGVGGFDFANRFSYKMWEGNPILPTGSLIGNFTVFVFCLFVYYVFYILFALAINARTKHELGLWAPVFLHCGLSLWWDYQVSSIEQDLTHHRFMRFMMQTGGGLLVWLALCALLLFLVYKLVSTRSPQDAPFDTALPAKRWFFQSGWFWAGTGAFLLIALYTCWNTIYYGVPDVTHYAGLNLYFQSLANISGLWTVYAYLFTALCCVDLYRTAGHNAHPWKHLLRAAFRGIMMVVIVSVILIVFYTAITGRFLIEEPLLMSLFNGIMAQTVVRGSMLEFLHQLAWLSVTAAVGYSFCTLLKDWRYCLVALAILFGYGSYLWNFIWQGTFLADSAPGTVFNIGTQFGELSIFIKEWVFVLCLSFLLVAFRIYVQKKGGIPWKRRTVS